MLIVCINNFDLTAQAVVRRAEGNSARSIPANVQWSVFSLPFSIFSSNIPKSGVLMLAYEKLWLTSRLEARAACCSPYHSFPFYIASKLAVQLAWDPVWKIGKQLVRAYGCTAGMLWKLNSALRGQHSHSLFSTPKQAKHFLVDPGAQTERDLESFAFSSSSSFLLFPFSWSQKKEKKSSPEMR